MALKVRGGPGEPEDSSNDMPADQVPGQGLSSSPITRSTQDQLGAQLRQMYDRLLDEPVPDHFADLITRLSQERSDER